MTLSASLNSVNGVISNLKELLDPRGEVMPYWPEMRTLQLVNVLPVNDSMIDIMPVFVCRHTTNCIN